MGFRAVETGSDGDAVVEALNALIGLLKDREPRVRAAAANSLGAISSAKAPLCLTPGPAITHLLAPKGQPALAAVVAAPVGTNSVITALEDALGDREASVRGAATLALAAASSKFEPPAALAVMLDDKSARESRVDRATLARYPLGLDWWIPALIRMAENDDDRSVRGTCQCARTDDPAPAVTAAAVPALVAGLASRDRKVRTAVANRLGRMGPEAEAAIPPLLRVLTEPVGDRGADDNDENVNLAGAVASALGQVAPGTSSSAAAITALTELALSGDRARQGAAAGALGRFGPAAAPAIPALIRMARAAGPSYNEAIAAQSLGLIAPETPAVDEVVTVLVGVLRSERTPSRLSAIKALERSGRRPRLRSRRSGALHGPGPRREAGGGVHAGGLEKVCKP